MEILSDTFSYLNPSSGWINGAWVINRQAGLYIIEIYGGREYAVVSREDAEDAPTSVLQELTPDQVTGFCIAYRIMKSV